MLQKLKNELTKELRFLIYLKHDRMLNFAKLIDVSNSYLARFMSGKKYLHTVLEYITKCDTKLRLKISSPDGRLLLDSTYSDVKTLVEEAGKYCKREVLKKYKSIQDFSEANNGCPEYQAYLSFRVNSRASLDHLVRYYNTLGYVVSISCIVNKEVD